MFFHSENDTCIWFCGSVCWDALLLRELRANAFLFCRHNAFLQREFGGLTESDVPPVSNVSTRQHCL
uniref:Uncharacterized protein n=1 Tax=Anguilla anguilla TaxID=7936 RepID=A0A0E9TSM6_ANGAN